MTQRMHEITRLTVVAALAIARVASANAQSVALVKSYDVAPYDAAESGFLDACTLRVSGYNLRNEASGHEAVIAAIRQNGANLVVAIGVLAAEFARESLSDLPLLHLMVPKPRELGLTGPNIAGIALDIPIDRQLRVYRSIVANLGSLGALYDPTKSSEFIAEAAIAAEENGLELHTREVASTRDVSRALRALLREEEIDALWMIPDATVVTRQSLEYLMRTSFDNGLPLFASSEIFVKRGALASLTPDYDDIGRQGCEVATQLAEGQADTTSFGIAAPEKMVLTINLNSAQNIGLTIPDEIVERADVVYR